MAGIAVFPTPASSPAMSSLSLAVERKGGPVFHAHTDPWLALSTALHPYRVLRTHTHTLQNASVSATPSVTNPQSNLVQSVHKHKHNKTLSLDRHFTLAYTNTSEAFPRQSLRRRSEPLFHLPPLTSGVVHYARLFAQRRHVSRASSKCGYLRTFSIYRKGS